MKILRKFVRVALLSLLFISFITGDAKAEEKKSFAISPPNFDINAVTGDQVKNTIRVENLSDAPLTLTAKGENFVAYGDEGLVSLTEEDSSYSINKWLIFPVKTFTVPAHKSYLFQFTLKIPENAEPGSHYGAVVFSSDPESNTTNGASVVQEIGALVLIRLPGDIKEGAQIVSFESSSKYYTEPKVKFSSLVENTGGVHFKMTSSISIYDIFGNKVKTLDGESKNVLPGNKRVFNSESDFDGFGYYRAQVDMLYSGQEKVLRKETTFVAFNTRKSVPIALGIIVIAALYFIFRKRINKAVKIIIKG